MEMVDIEEFKKFPFYSEIEHAVLHLPQSKQRDYITKLSSKRNKIGTLFEMKIINELFKKGKDTKYEIKYLPRNYRVDSLLIYKGQIYEIEITLDYKVKYEENVDKLCALARKFIKENYPAFKGFIHLTNFSSRWIEKDNKLDIENTFDNIKNILNIAFIDEKIKDEYLSHDPGRLICRIEPKAINDVIVWQSSYRLPGGLDVNQIKRKIFGKLDEEQFTFKNGAIFIIGMYRSTFDVLERDYDHVIEQVFSKYPRLSGCVAINCGYAWTPTKIYMNPNYKNRNEIENLLKSIFPENLIITF
jgi:hypothetical protein